MIKNHLKNIGLSAHQAEFLKEIEELKNKHGLVAAQDEIKQLIKSQELKIEFPCGINPLTGEIKTVLVTPKITASTIADLQRATQKESEIKKPLSKSSCLLNAPTRKDDWFEVINEMTYQFYAENGAIPTTAQAWNFLCTQPPKGYQIIMVSTDKNRKPCLNMMGCKLLNKSSFDKRWKNYTKQSQNHQA